MTKKSSIVVWQGKRVAVKQRINPDRLPSFDIWEWNVWKLKWVRLSNTACGYGELSHAQSSAEARDQEIEDMLIANASIPPPLK